MDSAQLTKRILFRVLICVFNVGLYIQPVKAQIDSLRPVWVNDWQGDAIIKGSANNAWDVHVYRDIVYATGIKMDNFWTRTAPLVLNAYTLDGDTVWQKTWEGYTGTYGHGAAGSVILGHGDYLYLGGAVSIDSMNASLIQKWDLDGNLIWSEYWGDKINEGHHEVNGLAIVDHNLYVSHYSAASGLVTADAHIKKFDLNKLDSLKPWSDALLWDIEYGQPGTQNTTDGHIYADSTGVYICGQTGGPMGSNIYDEGDSYLIKFNPQGDSLWMKLYTGNGTGCDNAFNLKSDGSHIYVLGFTTTYLGPLGFPFGLETQVFVQKYTMGGTLIWTQLYGGPKTEYARGLEVDDEHIYLGVSTKSYVDSAAGGLDNTLLIKLNKDSGDVVCQRLWGGLGIDGVTTSIDQDENGYIYLSGNTTTAEDGTDSGLNRAVILKVNKDCMVSTGEMVTSKESISFTVYPNPFSSETTLLLSDHLLQAATLTVYNSSGQAVKELNNLSDKTITLNRDDLPAGLFFIQLTQEHSIIASAKIIIQ